MSDTTSRSDHQSATSSQTRAFWVKNYDGVTHTYGVSASDRFSDYDPGMTGLGVALRNPAGAVDASLAFVLPDAGADPVRVAAIAATLLSAADAIDASLARLAGQTPS